LNYRPPSVFTPFLRRFTDEPALDLSETIALYHEVQRAHGQSPFAQPDIVAHVLGHCAQIVEQLVAVPNYLPFCQALDRCQSALIAKERTLLAFPEIDWTCAHLSMKEQIDLRV
jgi:hypothetical protein